MGRMTNKGSFDSRVHTITTAATPEHLGGYMVATTISFATNVISDSGLGFITKGFKNGDLITISGSSDNDGDYTVVTVAAGTLTLGSGVVLTTEVVGSTVTVDAIARAMGQEIDNGVIVSVRAHPDNNDLVYLANSATNASDTDVAVPLYANQSQDFQVSNLRSIWCDISATEITGKVIITFEK